VPVLGIHDLSPDRYPQGEVLTIGTGAFAPGARPAVGCAEMLPIAVVDQGVEIVGHRKDDVAALAAIATIGAAKLDELLAAKTRSSAPAVTAL